MHATHCAVRAAVLAGLLASLPPVIAHTTPAFSWHARDESSDGWTSNHADETALVSRRRRQRRPATAAPITRALLVGNGAAFLLTMQRRGLFDALAKNDMLLRSGQYHRLLTACFLHASIPHILVNSMSLNNLGSSVEHWFGAERFVCTYLVSGVAGNVLSWRVGQSPLSVGASGAIFGLLGAWGVFLKRNEGVFSPGVVQASLAGLVQTCALNAAMGMQAGAGIDNMGHLGGLLGGAACSYLFGPRLLANPYTGTIVDAPLLRLPLGLRRQRRGSGKRGGSRREQARR